MKVYFKNNLIGELINPIPDMWYLEGEFSPTACKESDEFIDKANSLDAKECFRDITKGIIVYLQEDEDKENTLFIVMSLESKQLFGRCVYDKKTIDWVKKTFKR